MKDPRIVFAVTAASALLLVAGVPVATAGQAPDIFPHRHFLVTPEGEVPVGPQVCGKPHLQPAFNQFHAAVHVGPANTAFDHTHNPVDVRGGPC